MKQIICSIGLMYTLLSANAQVVPTILDRALSDSLCVQWVDSVYQSLTPEERIGQLFVVTLLPTTQPETAAAMKEAVEQYKVGGLLFSGATLEAYAKSINYAQAHAKTPLLITFDGEWGPAMRIKTIPAYPRNWVLGKIKDNYLLFRYGQEVARQLRELGVQVNFAPVADVNTNPDNPVIGTRSFSNDAHVVADKVMAYSAGLEQGGVLSVSKHFPGHGDTNVDSHKALPVLSFDRSRLDSIELYPFRQYIRAGMGGIMTGHLEVPILEPQPGLPSSLSHHIVTGLLKEELGFGGLIFTDALAMKGVAAFQHPALRAIQAGNDMVLTPRPLRNEIEAVYNAVRDGRLSEQQIEASCRKILAYKYALGLSQLTPVLLDGLAERIDTAESRQLIQELEAAASSDTIETEPDPTAR